MFLDNTQAIKFLFTTPLRSRLLGAAMMESLIDYWGTFYWAYLWRQILLLAVDTHSFHCKIMFSSAFYLTSSLPFSFFDYFFIFWIYLLLVSSSLISMSAINILKYGVSNVVAKTFLLLSDPIDTTVLVLSMLPRNYQVHSCNTFFTLETFRNLEF